jgi:hypothetical protein
MRWSAQIGDNQLAGRLIILGTWAFVRFCIHRSSRFSGIIEVGRGTNAYTRNDCRTSRHHSSNTRLRVIGIGPPRKQHCRKRNQTG